jgi:polyhydroxybutyrate depolymerase
MKSRSSGFGAVLILISLPVVLVLVEAVTFYARNRENGSIVSSGETRKYEVYVPRSYDRSLPTPLVISMHGAGGWPVQQMSLTGWNRLAESQRFIVVYPAGTEGNGPRIWHVEQEPGLARDVRFISDLIDKLEATYNIDRQRIYANGFSNGGGMSFVLSCTLSDRIAAVGMVGAAQTLPWSWCKDRRAVPMIVFHGTEDPFVLYKGGKSWIAPDPFPNVPNWAANWARRNRCAPRPVETAVAAGVTRREYTNCADDASVVFYTIRGGGHTWPGGEPLPEWFVGPTSRSIDATSVMWAFFREHRLSAK